MAAVHGPGSGAIQKANMVGVNTESKLSPYVLKKKQGFDHEVAPTILIFFEPSVRCENSTTLKSDKLNLQWKNKCDTLHKFLHEHNN